MAEKDAQLLHHRHLGQHEAEPDPDEVDYSASQQIARTPRRLGPSCERKSDRENHQGQSREQKAYKERQRALVATSPISIREPGQETAEARTAFSECVEKEWRGVEHRREIDVPRGHSDEFVEAMCLRDRAHIRVGWPLARELPDLKPKRLAGGANLFQIFRAQRRIADQDRRNAPARDERNIGARLANSFRQQRRPSNRKQSPRLQALLRYAPTGEGYQSTGVQMIAKNLPAIAAATPILT